MSLGRRRLLPALLLLGGCEGNTATPSLGTPVDAGQAVTRQYFLGKASRWIDVAFVLDSGPPMGPWRDVVAADVAAVAELATRQRDEESSIVANLGVLSANPPPGGAIPDGILRASGTSGGCLAGPPGFIASACRTGNFAPADVEGLRAAAACLATQPPADTVSAPLAALLTGLNAPRPAPNQAFLRDDAYLLVAIVSASDDASTDLAGRPLAVEDVARAVAELKVSSDMIATVVIGPAAAPRLRAFADAMDAYYGVLGQDGILAGMAIISSLSCGLPGRRCLAGPPADGDPAPGLQPRCTVRGKLATYRAPAMDSTWIPACGEQGFPCWEIQANAECASGWEVKLRRDPLSCSDEYSIAVECELQP